MTLLLLSASLFAADPLARDLDPNILSRLRAGDALTARLPSDGALRLAPRMNAAEREAMAPRHPTVGVELLTLIDGARSLDTPQGMLRLFNILHAVSTLKGIPYYSVTRGNTQVLFSQSYALAAPTGNVRIPDPVFASLPQADVLYTFQEDQSFGRNTYEETFVTNPDHLSVRIENLSTISLLFVPIIRPRNLVSYVALIPRGNELAFYGLAWLTTGFPIGDRHSREESLLNRLKAMGRWLETQIGAP